MDSGEAAQPAEPKPKSRFLVFKDRLLSPSLKEYRPQAAESQHRHQVAAAVPPAVVHGTPEGSSCCQLSLGGRAPAPPPPAVVTPTPRRSPPPPPSPEMVGDGSDSRRGDEPTGTGKASGLPVAKSSSAVDASGVRRSQSARGGVASPSTRRTVTLADPPVTQTRACIHGVSSADDVIVASSSSHNDVSDEPSTSSSRPEAAAAASKIQTRSPSGFMSRIARKSSAENRRPKTADGADTVTSDSVSRDQTGSPSATSSGSRGQDFPFIFSLLRASQPQQQQEQQQQQLAASAHALSRISEGVAAGNREQMSPVTSCTSIGDRDGHDDVIRGKR